MRVLVNRRSVLISTVVVLLASFLLVPMVNGIPGQNYGSAPTVAPGTYYEYMPSGWVEGLYNVSGQVGYTLTVTIEFLVVDGFELTVRSPTGVDLDTDLYSSLETSETVSTVCDSNLKYTIYLLRQNGSGDANFTLIITLTAPDSGIPGFGIFIVFSSFLILLGIVVYLNKRKLKLNN